MGSDNIMAERQPTLRPPTAHPELDRLLDEALKRPITNEELEEQRVSFAFGNAPEGSRITKDSVRAASKTMRIEQN